MKKRLLSLALCLALCLGLLPVGVLATEGESGGIYVPSGPTEGGGGTYIPGEDTRTEIWRDTSRYQSISRSYDGTTDGSTIKVIFPFTDGSNEIQLEEGKDCEAVKTFDSADAGSRTVTVELKLIGDAATKYKLKEGSEKFTIGGNINKAYPKLTVSLSKTTCAVGEKLLPLLSVDGVQEGAAVTYYYTPIKSGYLEFEGSDAVPKIDENTAISEPGTYYVYAKTGETKNYKEERSATVALTVSNDVASVTTSSGVTNNYTSLDDALNAAQNGDTVTLLSDVDLGETSVTISKSITFDLNGKTLSSSGAWLRYGVLLVKDATVTVKNGTVKAAGDGSCAIQAYRSGASMTLEDVTATVTSNKSSVTVGDFGSAVIKSGDYQGLYVGAKSQVTLEGGTFRPYMDTIITNENVKSIFWKVNETTDATSRDCMELLEDGCVYLDESRNQVRTGGGFNTVVTVQKGTPIDTPVAKIGDVGYTSLSKAINAVQNGGTITLLNDLDLDNGAVLQVGSSKKNFTIDLDNHTLSADGACLIMLHNGSQLTLKNGTLDGSRCTSYDGVLFISSNSGPKLTLENVTAKSGTVADTLNGQRSVLLAYVTYGTVEFDGGVYTGGVLLTTNGSAVLKSGTFQKGDNTYSIKTEASGKHLPDYLDESLFWKNDALLDLSNETQTADEVTVRPCEHNWENGKCTVCQKVCDHGSADGKSMTEDLCPTCGMKAAAQVDITGSDAKYFPSFTDALVYATKNNGCTLKLLADVVDVTVNTDKSFIFDLNGCEVYSLNVNSRITLKDSSGGNGKITEWLKVPSGMKVGELLEDGYALRKSDSTWASETDQAVGGVSILPVPIRSVTAANPSVTVEYGKTADVTLRATVVPSADEDETVSCQWHIGGGTMPKIEGATGNTYQLPADLDAGEHNFYLIATKDGYKKSCEFTVTVTPVSLEGATVAVKDLTYNGEAQTPEVTVKLGEKTLVKGKDFSVFAEKQTNAGSYTLTISGNGNYTGTKTVEWKIKPIKIDHAKFVKNITKTYSGEAEFTLTPAEKTNCLEFYDSHMTPISIPEGEYTISGMRFVAKNAEGEYVDSPQVGDKVIQFTITFLNNNYVLQTACDEQPASSKTYNQSGGATFTITKADAPTVTPGKLTVVNNHEGTYTYDLKQLLPTAPNGTYGNIDWNGGYQHSFSSQFSYVKNYTIDNDGILTIISHDNNLTTTGKVGTITITVITDNYENISLPIEVFAENKILPELDGSVSLSKTAITFGESLDSIIVSGTMKDGDTTVEGTFSWPTSKELYPAGTHEVEWMFTPTNSGKYAVATGKVTITVNKATPTGKPEYTAITTSGKKLSDASLTQAETSFSVPGTVAWNLPADTEVTANTAYTWKFTPYDENYTDLTGTITLWHKSSSGSSSGSVTPGTKTDTVKNPDGSTTKTETKADGSKTETTTASSGGGSTGTTVTKTDAKGNTTTEASAKLSDQDVKEAQEKGEAVTVPVKGISAAKDANAATKIKIDVPNNANKTTVEIPVENVTSGTVAVIVHEDGTEELVKDSKPTEHGVQLELSGSTTVKIIDNSKTFDDTKDHWSRDEVNFVAARELFNGVGGNQFGVSQPMTRGMVNTVLARLAGVDTTPSQGQAWYEVGTDWAKKNGISDGTNPTAPVTREQLATLLYRYAGSPSVSGTLHAADAASVSDYAEDALLWANQNGIVNGVGSNTIAPKDNAQRAQVAAMLARYLQNQ